MKDGPDELPMWLSGHPAVSGDAVEIPGLRKGTSHGDFSELPVRGLDHS